MKRKGLSAVLETIVMVAIVLVLVQTFLEDWSVVAGWSVAFRNALVVTGFCFDLFFTVEFLVRLEHARQRGQAGRYFLHERGWVDFLASLPLVLLSSGPGVLTLLTGLGAGVGAVGFLNVLKVVKAIRIARVLRLMRAVKLFRQIKYADSVMAQRHVTKVTGMAVTAFVFTIFVFSLVTGLVRTTTLESSYRAQIEASVARVRANIGGIDAGTVEDDADTAETDAEAFARIVGAEPGLLLAKRNGAVLAGSLTQEAIARSYQASEYRYEVWTQGNAVHELWFDLRPIAVEEAVGLLLHFLVVVAIVIALLAFYSPHFAMTISDPITIMQKGFGEKGYNLEVKVPELYAQDDVYRLAADYNAVYLPMKDRAMHEGSEAVASDLDLSDYGDILSPPPSGV